MLVQVHPSERTAQSSNKFRVHSTHAATKEQKNRSHELEAGEAEEARHSDAQVNEERKQLRATSVTNLEKSNPTPDKWHPRDSCEADLETAWRLAEDRCCGRLLSGCSLTCGALGSACTAMSKFNCCYRCFLSVVLSLFILPKELASYFAIIFAPEVMAFTFLLDTWDTVSDVILAVNFGGEKVDYQFWVIMALIFGTWNLVYEFFWIVQGRSRLTAYKSFMINNVADPHKAPGSDTGSNGRGKFANTLAMFGRCVAEDGLVMIAALLRGKKIEGLGEQSAFATSLLFLALCILNMADLLILAFSHSLNERYPISPVLFTLCVGGIPFGVMITLWVHFLLLFFTDVEYSEIAQAFIHLAGVIILMVSFCSLGCQSLPLETVGTRFTSNKDNFRIGTFSPVVDICGRLDECCACAKESKMDSEDRKSFFMHASMWMFSRVSKPAAWTSGLICCLAQ